MKSIFIINQHIFEKEFPKIQEEAAKIFTDFVSNKKYCGKQNIFWFDAYVEDEINIGRNYISRNVGRRNQR